MKIWKPPKMWEGGTCFIIGGGMSVPHQFGVPKDIIDYVISRKSKPNLYSEYMSELHDKHVIGINNVYQIGQWIDILFFGDNSWYLVHKNAIAEWPKIKVTCNPRFEAAKRFDIKYMRKNKKHGHGICSTPGMVSWNGNSGAASISLAVQLGAKTIILLGFDMCLSDSISHWHGSHVTNGRPKRSPPFVRHMKGFPQIAKDAKELGVEILNASPISKIECFRKVKVKDYL